MFCAGGLLLSGLGWDPFSQTAHLAFAVLGLALLARSAAAGSAAGRRGGEAPEAGAPEEA
ncbi:MAG TPA: hypothetical protein VFU47_02840 [Armatimonadota bacterium]|nr:hypothetical protein [Armatimonadota bacterium]